MTVALSMGVLLGICALAIDSGYLYLLKNRLQATADAAALAGASQLPIASDVRTVATDFAGKNMAVATHGSVLANGDVVLGHWDAEARTFTPAGNPINAVRVTTKRSTANNNPAELSFARFLGFDEVNLETVAVAWPGPDLDDQTCILSLELTLPSAITVSGGGVNLDLGGCGISINSTDPTKAIEVSTSSDSITAGKICVKGGMLNGGGMPILNPDGAPDPTVIEEGCDPPPDPLAGLAPPSNPGCNSFDDSVLAGSGDVTLYPGTYCGGINISGSGPSSGSPRTITFQPGEYIIAGGGFLVGGSDIILNGDGVVFYNTDNNPDPCGQIDFSGSNNTVNFSAPLTGAYAGVLFFQDPSPSTDCSGVKFMVAGTTTANMDGVLYFPNHLVQYSGTVAIVDPCGPKIISRFVDFNGTSGVVVGPRNSSCASNKVFIGGVILRLVF